jgi:hypothetical protein
MFTTGILFRKYHYDDKIKDVMGEACSTYERNEKRITVLLPEYMKERDYLGYLNAVERIILKWLRK